MIDKTEGARLLEIYDESRKVGAVQVLIDVHEVNRVAASDVIGKYRHHLEHSQDSELTQALKTVIDAFYSDHID